MRHSSENGLNGQSGPSQGVPASTDGESDGRPGVRGEPDRALTEPEDLVRLADDGSGGAAASPGDSVDVQAIRKRFTSLEFVDFGAADDPIRKKFPYLSAFLFRKSWNGSASRQTARLTITATTRGLRVRLTCPTEGKEAEIDVRHWDELLPALEEVCATDSKCWRELDRGPGAVKRRENRKKKDDTRGSWDL
jgi:hypothetical protein